MLTTAEQLRLAAIELVVAEDDCIENVLHNDFWSYVSRGREAKAFARGELDYSVKVDVTENVPDLGPTDWVLVGGDEPREVYMLCVEREEIGGRQVWTFEARFCDDLPVRQKGSVVA